MVHLQGAGSWKPPELRLLVGTRLRVAGEADGAWRQGSVAECTAEGHRILFDDGDSDTLDLTCVRYELLAAEGSDSADPLWARNIENYWRARLGDNAASREVISVMRSSLADTTRGNYHPKQLEYLEVCAAASPPRIPVPASPDTVMFYLGYLKSKHTVSAKSVTVYLSAVNKLHVELGYAAPALGVEARDFIRGMGRIQRRELDDSGLLADVRSPLPSYVVAAALDRAMGMSSRSASFSQRDACLWRSLVFVVVNYLLFCRGDTGVTLPPHHLVLDDEGIHVVPLKEKGRDHLVTRRVVTIPREGVAGLHGLLVAYKAWHASLDFGGPVKARRASLWRLPHEMQGRFPSSKADAFLQTVLSELGFSPPAGLSWTSHSMRKGSSSAAKAIGCLLEAICHFAGWSILAGTFHTYIDPTWVPTTHCWRLFSWMRPPDRPPGHM